MMTRDPESLLRVACEAQFLPDGEAGWIDLGDVKVAGVEPSARVREVKRATRWGTVETRRARAVEVGWAFSLELREWTREVAELFFLATAEDWEQAETLAGAAALEGVRPRRRYELGARGVAGVEVRRGEELLVEGRDYAVDAALGQIAILEAGSVQEGDDLAATFRAGARRGWRARAGAAPHKAGTLLLLGWESEDGPRFEMRAGAVLAPAGEIAFEPGAFAAPTLEAAVTGQPLWTFTGPGAAGYGRPGDRLADESGNRLQTGDGTELTL
jgi:hypothetical protein